MLVFSPLTTTTHRLVLQKQLAYACTFTFLQVVLSIYMVICKKTHEELFPFFIPFASQTQPHWVEMVIIRRTFSVCSISNNIAMLGEIRRNLNSHLYICMDMKRGIIIAFMHIQNSYTHVVVYEKKRNCSKWGGWERTFEEIHK